MSARLALIVLLALVGCSKQTGLDTDTDIGDDGDTDTNVPCEPQEEMCDSIDNDCDGEIDEGVKTTFFEDKDKDGFGAAAVEACDQPTGTATADGDCDDDDDGINPAAEEDCNGLDENCDGEADEGIDRFVQYRDFDGDGYGDPGESIEDCTLNEGYVRDDTDCEDADAGIYPGAEEICNLYDDDCDGDIDEDLAVDWYADRDGDGYGDPKRTVSDCAAPENYVSDDTDCNDKDIDIHPDADELCNGVDDDCDTLIDNDAIDGADYPVDSDSDGFGSPTVTEYACEGVDNTLDCDDTNALEPKVVDLTTGSATGTGTLWAAFDTIQAGIDASDLCVLVYPGTYDEAVSFNGKNISVTGVEGASSTIIDATATTPSAVVTFANLETGDAVLSGFTLTGGTGRLETTSETTGCGSEATCTTYYNTYCGGGVAVDGASPTLIDLIIGGNTLPAAGTSTSGSDTTYTYSFGGGVCLQSADGVVLTGVDLYENYADQGGGLYADAGTTFDFSQGSLFDNSATDGGGVALDGATASFTNVLSAWNTATELGGGVYASGGTLGIWNGTYGFDAAADGGGFYLSGAVSASVDSAIVYAVPTGDGVDVQSGASFLGAYNNVYGNSAANYTGVTDPTGTSGNISADPKFASVSDDGDPYNDDWSLDGASPSVNTGNPTRTDPDGSMADQGAYGGAGASWK